MKMNLGINKKIEDGIADVELNKSIGSQDEMDSPDVDREQ